MYCRCLASLLFSTLVSDIFVFLHVNLLHYSDSVCAKSVSDTLFLCLCALQTHACLCYVVCDFLTMCSVRYLTCSTHLSVCALFSPCILITTMTCLSLLISPAPFLHHSLIYFLLFFLHPLPHFKVNIGGV